MIVDNSDNVTFEIAEDKVLTCNPDGSDFAEHMVTWIGSQAKLKFEHDELVKKLNEDHFVGMTALECAEYAVDVGMVCI